MSGLHVHRSPWAGTWYPDDPAGLGQLLAEAGAVSTERTGAFVRPGALAFLVPHAAPAYSGVVAASAFRNVPAAGAARAIILGFSHRHAVRGVAVPQTSCIATPLGTVQVDRAAADALAASPPFHSVPEELVCDHSVEIQVPFLQVFASGMAIVPLYIGSLEAGERQTAARALHALMDGHTVLIASSDLTHYGPDFGYQPFELRADTPGRLRELDMGALSAAGSLDPALFRNYLEQSGATVCGVAPIELLLETLRGLDVEVFQETLDYQASGELVHDYRHSVSYGAAGYFRASAWELGPPQQAALLQAARFSLDQFRRTREQQFPAPVDPSLRQRGRAFVTILERDAIRGCVGCFETPHPLAQCVPRLTLDACADGRFGPIENWDELEIEVHVLTPPKRIASPDRLQPGEHGAFLKAGPCRGLLLPVVAERHGLDREHFLRVLARKAGLPETVYSGTDWELSIFRDQTFREQRA